MELISFAHGGASHVGAHDSGSIVNLAAASAGELPADMLSLLRLGDSGLSHAARVAAAAGPEHRLALADVQLLAPVPRPGKVFAMAANYADHIVEGGGELREKAGRLPLVFSKISSAVIGPDEPVLLPDVSQTVDWELELAVVIGKPARRVPAESAFDYVAGYSIMNDISARTMNYPGRTQFGPMEEWFDFINGKWCDTFAPCGPFLVTRDAIANPDDLSMQLTVNGRVWQDANTKLMIFKIPEIIEFISRWSTLEPGDIISTGTPAGTGEAADTYLQPGDVIQGTIEGLGTLRTPVAASAP